MYQIITGGIEKCLLRMIEHLMQKNKYNICIIVKKPVCEQYFLDFFHKYNIEVLTINNKYKNNVLQVLNKSDIVIDYFNCAFLYELQSVFTPKIGVYHSSIIFFDNEFIDSKDILFNTYDKFVCLTKSFREDVIERFPKYKNKIIQIYNPFNIDKLRKLADEGEYPKDKSKYFVFLGRFHQDKDHICVIKAFDLFIKKNPDGKIYFLGAGDKENEYRSIVKNLNLEDKIIFTGAIPNPYGYLKHSTANILSSPNEGLSNVLVEGAILGVLNISSNCKSSAAEVLLDGKGGILYPIGDSNNLATIMDDVWNNRIDKSYYINNATNSIGRFDINIVIKQFEDLISEVIASSAKNNINKRSYVKKILQNLISVKNEYSIGKKHKVFTIFGIKLKFQSNKHFKLKIKKRNISYKKIIKQLRNELKNRKIRVCFLVNETAKWNAQNLYNELKKSEKFEPFVVVTNLQYTLGRPAYSHLLNYYKSCVDNVKIGWDETTKQAIDLATFKPDIVFFQQSGELYDNQKVNYVCNFALTYHFSYAMGDPIPVLKEVYDEFYSLLYKYFVFSNAEACEYKESMNDTGHNIFIVGHPKLDIYKDYKEENYKHKYVIYAPHHSFEENSLHFSTFQWNGKYILEWAKKHPEFDWVFKPHPRFKQALLINNILSEKEVDEYFEQWNDIGIYYNDGSYFDLFKNSKCLITDCGSFLIEYLPSLQPLIHLRNPKAKDYIPSQRVVMDSFYQAWNLEQLEKLLQDVLIQKNDEKKIDRINALKQLNISDYNSTRKIIDSINADIFQKL